jgi:hypothetical protein
LEVGRGGRGRRRRRRRGKEKLDKINIRKRTCSATYLAHEELPHSP